MGETKWEKGVEIVSCDFLRFPAVFWSFPAAPNHFADQAPNQKKSARIFDKLPFLPFSLSPFSAAQNYNTVTLQLLFGIH